jgi:hypothetical protein
MYGYNILVAMALLTAPPDSLPTPKEADLYAGVREPLRELAIQWEILDTREAPFMLARAEEFQDDLNMLRRRYQELADAPSVHDAMRFPSRTVVTDYLDFNRSYRRNLDLRQPVERARWWEFQTALEETEQLYHIWDTVRDARCECYYVHIRRRALKSLRTMIGEDAYYSGKLPPYVPVWRFQEID